MKYSERLPVLLSEIPPNGRKLEKAEVKRIKYHGYHCVNAAKVRRSFGSSKNGIIYFPAGTMDHENIYVTMQ